MSCTVFHTTDKNGNVLVGRNFDWDSNEGRVWFIPGNEKINSIAIFEQDGTDMPFEGVNNKGLLVAITAVSGTRTPFSILKPIRKSLELVRIILEQSSVVRDALKIFQNYSIVFGSSSGHPLIHYKITDANGDSAIIEYIDNEIKITKDSVMTNHYNSNPVCDAESQTSFSRYRIAHNALKMPPNSIADVHLILKAVSQDTTIWSNVYDLTNNKIHVSYMNAEIISFNFEEEQNLGKHGYNLKQLNDINRKVLTYTEKKPNFLFRPHSGYGFIKGEGIWHYGGRLLFAANKTQKYGLEINRFKSTHNNFTSAGIIFEQRLLETFNMSIGTLGYFNYGTDSKNITGLTTSVGWEPDNHIPFKPFVTYRNDVIFGKNTNIIHSISIGFAFEF